MTLGSPLVCPARYGPMGAGRSAPAHGRVCGAHERGWHERTNVSLCYKEMRSNERNVGTVLAHPAPLGPSPV
jgi:hypothetical protein